MFTKHHRSSFVFPLQCLPFPMAAVVNKRARFENALARIGFSPEERLAFIQASGCTNVAMIGLLSTDQINRLCKRLST
jgi:hypothetical protein